MKQEIPPNWVLKRIKERLTYDPDTGDLIWCKIGPYNRNIQVGDKAGFLCKGYPMICFSDKLLGQYRICSHNIAWFLYYGEWPISEIDHRFGISEGNRIDNLRIATRSQNNMNRTVQTNNTSGASGVGYSKSRKKYRVRIKVCGKEIHIGYFLFFEDAVVARRNAELTYYGEYASFNGITGGPSQNIAAVI